jgi:AraC family transcriptional regulator of adaptative response/methylated-DNA-[protein]-cysteine methyltransferase
VNDAARWQAVLDRDRRFDGTFVFAVRTTGVYCRPTCPARRPRRANVSFFPRPDEAEDAGFRSCRRCRPKEADRGTPDRVERVCRHIESLLKAGLPVRVTVLAAAVGLSPHHLLRSFKHALGMTPRQYADVRRIAALKTHLKEGMPVTDATYEAGYGSSSRLYERSDSHLGMTPATYSRGGRGATIGYTVVSCPLGRMLVAATERGVSAVYFGDSDRPLESALRQEYPEAKIETDEGARSAWVRNLVARVSGAEAPDVPLDIQATAFQWRVFQALREIPPGQTRTYGEIARSIGSPRAARAVGRACATNRVAVAIPCHRAIGSTGALTGYRWGVKRKQALLAAEARRANADTAEGTGRRG